MTFILATKPHAADAEHLIRISYATECVLLLPCLQTFLFYNEQSHILRMLERGQLQNFCKEIPLSFP